MSKIKISNKELAKCLIGEIKEFPRYTTQLMNLANQNAQGTRPKVVGQLSELIKECPGKSYQEWKEWYLKKYPNAVDAATEKINTMVEKLKSAIIEIDASLIHKWVEDLVLEKTFIGLRFQEAILMKVAELNGIGYRFSTPHEESQGIDGFVGDTAVSIKPVTYKTKRALAEEIKAKIIFYEKKKSGLEIDASEIFHQQ